MNDFLTPIDSLDIFEQRLSHFERYITEISSNTDAFSGVSLGVTIITAAASIITICGFVTIFWEFWKRDTSKEWQRRIALDLIRHFMVNNAIVEVIRSKTAGQPNSYHPIEGVFSRFATLDSDTDLARFSINKKNYEKIHNLSLKIRNYNHVVRLADKHFCDPNYPKEAKEQELKSIIVRSVDINKKLIKFCKTLKKDITKEIIHQYIIEDRYNAEKVEEWKQEGNYCENFTILSRNDFPEHEYYDKELDMKEAFDQQIRRQAALIQFVNY